ncbi:MAG TPA: helix-turn-helix transcriptional regulator [Candidatus Acutalibacter ornithocaccae]|uniref:Helix-turn-helix transcriptional regulator n=1 Tax=Candidatus Acutalibacter ornithocaccae TaxID=2838416 RepID=A0A9D2M0L9_9FIRM|nr:helix-turn-helix transcriptional regulator [Candidatus Acutalibacter ornithocaccae]
MNRSAFSKKAGISYPVVDRYYKNTVHQYDSTILLQICLTLHCDIGDLLEIVDE